MQRWRKNIWRLYLHAQNLINIYIYGRTLVTIHTDHNLTAYISGYTGRICLRFNLYSQHIKKLLQSKRAT